MPAVPATKTYVLNCELPVKDCLFDINEFTQFFHDKIKVDGKTGNFEQVAQDGSVNKRVVVKNTNNSIIIKTKVPMRKRYIKYIAKMYLHECSLRDYLRVLADSSSSYKIRYLGRNNKSD